VRFAGYQSPEQRLPLHYAAADCLVSHSMAETFGLVMAEAMAAGLPIIAARASCVPVVIPPSGGILFEPFDLRAFADAVLSLDRDRARARAIGAENRAYAARHLNWDAIALEYLRALTGGGPFGRGT